MKKNSVTFFVVIILIFMVFGVYAASPNKPRRGPINPAFTDLFNQKLQTASIATTSDHSLGYIPSPIPPEIHQRQAQPLSAIYTDPKYDMRDPDNDGDPSDSLLTPVKNQGSCGSCWAFGTYGGLESQIKKDFFMEDIFSEDNLKHLHGFDLGPCEGGNVYMSSAYLSRYDGPISDSDDPYDPSETSDYCVGCPPVRYIDNLILLPARSDTSDNDFIKQAILEHGGIYVSFYWNSAYYDSSNYTYYYDGSNTSNHAVVAVGWDDNMVTDAATPGAFIIRNSWGEGWGEEGYFYISYEDTILAFQELAYFDEKSDTEFDFNRVYFHDELGWVYSYGYGTDTAYGASLFTADADGELTAIGFYAVSSNMSYEIKIYDNFSGTHFSGQLGNTQTGTFSYPGWYTVKLDSAVAITKDDEFGVTVKFTTSGNSYPVPVEGVYAGYSSAATASPGESYISSNGITWYDVSADGDNVNIKAYANINECNINYSDDLNDDGDVDGLDLAALASNQDFTYLSDFASNFGADSCYK